MKTRGFYQTFFPMRGPRLTHDQVSVHVQNDQQIQPALCGPDGGISVSHFLLGAGAVKSRCSTLGATGSSWRLSAVQMRHSFCSAGQPACCIRRAIRCLLQMMQISTAAWHEPTHHVLRILPACELEYTDISSLRSRNPFIVRRETRSRHMFHIFPPRDRSVRIHQLVCGHSGTHTRVDKRGCQIREYVEEHRA
jgi:hypothetical protein